MFLFVLKLLSINRLSLLYEYIDKIFEFFYSILHHYMSRNLKSETSPYPCSENKLWGFWYTINIFVLS